MGAVCSKVYTLERVLEIKKDGNTGRSFLDESLKVLGDRPSLIFWRTVADCLREEAVRGGGEFDKRREREDRKSRELDLLTFLDNCFVALASTPASSFIQQTLSNDYPKLLRILKEFFAKTSVYTYTVYEDSQQR